MREIKFRAWDKQKKIMSVVWEILFAGMNDSPSANEVALIQEHREFKRGVDTQVELLQFTGLYDNNNKAVFEGDIVQLYGGVLGRTKLGNPGRVSYCRGAFAVNGTRTLVEEKDYRPFTDSFEIVGNIYENPELVTASMVRGIKNEEVKQ